MIGFEITPANEALMREKMGALEDAISDLIDAALDDMLDLVTVTVKGFPLPPSK